MKSRDAVVVLVVDRFNGRYEGTALPRGEPMTDVTIDHNPDCGTSHIAHRTSHIAHRTSHIALILHAGDQPTVKAPGVDREVLPRAFSIGVRLSD